MKCVRIASIIGACVVTGGILAGCGPTTKSVPTTHPATKNTSTGPSAMAPRTLTLQPIGGHAISVLPGRPTWVTVHDHRNLFVEALPSTGHPPFVIPYHLIDCAGSGALSRVGASTVVTGCTTLWVLHQNQWRKRPLPTGSLGTAASITGTGHQWWDLAYGAGASGNERVAIWTSTNQGTSWTREATSSSEPHALPYYGDKTGLAADPQGTLWLTEVSAIVGHGGPLYHGPSNARRWSETPLHIPSRWKDAAIASYPPLFPTAHGGYLPVTVDGSVNERLALYTRDHTTHTWKLAGSVPGAVATTHWSLAASSATSLWVTMGHQLWVSHDAGTTWHDAWKTPPHWDLVSVRFAGPRNGGLLALRPAVQAAGDVYALWVTHDGGTVWQSRGHLTMMRDNPGRSDSARNGQPYYPSRVGHQSAKP